MRTKKLISALAITSATLFVVGTAHADTGTTQRQAQPYKRTQKQVTESTVLHVDTFHRMLTLMDDQGREFEVEVPQGVTRLSEIREGDRVRIDYRASTVLSLEKPGARRPVVSERNVRSATTLPSGKQVRTVRQSVQITNIDRDKGRITIRNPNGGTSTLTVPEDERGQLANLQKGDRVQATYTEATAVRVKREQTAIRQPVQQQPRQQQQPRGG